MYDAWADRLENDSLYKEKIVRGSWLGHLLDVQKV
ncbi:unnamed protein product, partial [marine sediment metagenome]